MTPPATSHPSTASYSNPIIPGFYPDPSIIRVASDYYCVTSTFEFFPGVPVLHSRDLVNWRTIGHCLTRPSQLDLTGCQSSRGIWAATIRHNPNTGRFYMVTTVMNHGKLRKFIVSATNPAGPWSEPAWIEQPGIDPSILFDDDGNVYLTSNGGADGKKGFNQALLDPDTGKLLSPDRLIWTGTGGAYPEGPRLFKHLGYYYLSVAEGGCQYGHMQTLARSKSPWGPFEPCPRNPIASHRDRGGHPIQGLGHAEFFTDTHGNWWTSMLGYRISTQFFYHLGRETFLAPVTWDSEGWPVIGHHGHLELEMTGPLPAPAPFDPEPTLDDFNAPELGLQYIHLRNPEPGSVSLTARPGHLTLVGNQHTLDVPLNPAFVGRRQQDFDCRARTRLDFTPAAPGHEAGLTAFYQEEHHYEIAKVWGEKGPRLIVRRRVGDLQAIVADIPSPTGPIELFIQADKKLYHLGYIDGGELRILATGRTQHLSCEAAPVGFTGVILALYATRGAANGSAASARNPAHFDFLEYSPLNPPPAK
jgi:alpha-N-arabinofuranosidase